MPVVTIKLNEEEYEQLKKRALEEGFSSVPEYIKDLMFKTEGLVEKKIVSEEKTGEKESLVQPLIRTIQDMINPFTAKIDELARSIGDLKERIEALEEKVMALEKPVTVPARRETMYAPSRRTSRSRKSAIDHLHDEGVVFQSELSWLNNPKAFFDKLKREGAVVIEGSRESIAVDAEYWDNFVSRLKTITAEDPREVERMLPGKMASLFKKLVDEGRIFYDKLENKWSIAV